MIFTVKVLNTTCLRRRRPIYETTFMMSIITLSSVDGFPMWYVTVPGSDEDDTLRKRLPIVSVIVHVRRAPFVLALLRRLTFELSTRFEVTWWRTFGMYGSISISSFCVFVIDEKQLNFDIAYRNLLVPGTGYHDWWKNSARTSYGFNCQCYHALTHRGRPSIHCFQLTSVPASVRWLRPLDTAIELLKLALTFQYSFSLYILFPYSVCLR